MITNNPVTRREEYNMKTKGQEIYEELLAMRLNAKTDEEKAQAERRQLEAQEVMDERTMEEYNAAILAEAQADYVKLDNIISEMKEKRMRERLGDIAQVVSLSYIAKNYFGKSRAWLFQRINGNKVNGREARFSEAECLQLQNALHDLGRRLSSVALV